MRIEAKELAYKHDFNLRWVMAPLRLRRGVFWAAVLVILALSAAVFAVLPSYYVGRTLLLVEVPQNEQGNKTLHDEVEVLRSRIMARRVVERLNLMSDPEFNRRFDYDSDEVGQNFKKLSVYNGVLESLPEGETDIDAVVSRFLKATDVRLIKNSNVIEIKFRSLAANKAALVTNSLADLYLEKRFDAKFQAVSQLTGELEGRLAALREKVRLAEAAVVAYRREHGIDGDNERGGSEGAADLVGLSTLLEAAKVEHANIEALLNRVKSAKDTAALPEKIISPLLRSLNARKADLKADLSLLSLRYGEKHPKIIEIGAAIDDAEQALQRERAKIIAGIKNDMREAGVRVRTLEEEIERAKAKGGEDADILTHMNVLQREAESARLVFDTFLETYRGDEDAGEDAADDQTARFTARVLSYAVPAGRPGYPDKAVWWVGSLIVSVLAGFGVVAVFTVFDRSIRNAAELEKEFGVPCYGLIPFMALGSKKELADYVISKPSSALAESIRTLRTVIGLRAGVGRKKPKVLTVTSSLSGEGKSALSIWLGRLSAKSDEKVIIIDADLRGADLHDYVGQENNATLVDYLTDRKELSDVIQKTDASNVHMIYGRNVPNSALDLLSTDKMEKLIGRLRKAYDLVIINAPACLGVSDAQVLASVSDHAVYVVEWGRTSRDVIKGGVKQFKDMDGVSMSFVLMHVDMNRYEKFYGQYSQCYND